MSEISLTASMRSNLLSLQNIASQQDIVQNRLATGLKVSSAIDNPSSYYTASSLNNRAADLTALLDAMSQGIQTIKAASEGLETQSNFIRQAQAVLNTAMEKSQPVIAVVNNETELLEALNTGQEGLYVINADISFSDNLSIELKKGQSLVGARYLNENAAQTKISFNFVNSQDSGILLNGNNLISDLDIEGITDTRNENAIIQGQQSSGNILQNLNFSINSEADASTDNRTFSAVRLGGFDIRGTVNIIDSGEIGDGSSVNRQTNGFYACDITLSGNAKLNIKMNGFWGAGIYFGSTILKDNASLNIESNGAHGYALNENRFYAFDDSRINFNSGGVHSHEIFQLNDRCKAYINSKTFSFAYTTLEITSAAAELVGKNASTFFYPAQKGQITTAAGASIRTNAGLFTAPSNGILQAYIIGTNDLSSGGFTKTDSTPAAMDSNFTDYFADFENNMQKELEKDRQNSDIFLETAAEEQQYQLILRQIAETAADSSYKGINLLQNQKLKINFNEDRSSKIEVNGADCSLTGLGLITDRFKTRQDLLKATDELTEAMNRIRNFSSELGNYFSIITTRQDFTENLINVLEEGADKLTLADMNQESANMLALQTSQQLAVNSLSLASQASQTVLRLF